jgi:ABC-type glycerol-3-phosphate transport system substrate-binding protein
MHPLSLSRRRLFAFAAGLAASARALAGRSTAAQDATATPTPGGLVEIEPTATAGAGAGGGLSGTIVISFQGNDTQTWQAMADAYMERNPNVEVRVELKPPEGYQEFIRAQFAAGTPETSLVNANVVADLLNAKKFLDMSAYLDRPNPYTGQPWRESMDPIAIENMRDPLTGEMNVLNLETVQVLWFYNESAFEAAGILEEARAVAQTERNQPTWDQFLGWCDKLTAAGYFPVAIEGDFRSFWEFRFGWLARMYLDQFTRDEAEIVRAQPGDWNFRPGIDDVWAYDPTDPHNDDANKVTFSVQRQMIALRDHVQSVNGPKFQALYTNFKQFNDRAAAPG